MAHKSEALPAPAPIESRSWRSVWRQTLIRRPSPATFETLARDPNASSITAYLWIFASSMISFILFIVVFIVSNVWPGSQRSLLPILFGGVPIIALLSVFTFLLSTGVTQMAAKVIRGTGTYPKLAYSIAAFSAPLALILAAASALAVSVLGRIASPLVAILSLLLLVFLFGIYGFVLSVMAIKTVHQLEWRDAIVVGIAGAFALVFGGILAVVVLLLLDYFNIFRSYLLAIFVLLPAVPLCMVAFVSVIRWRELRPSIIEDAVHEVEDDATGKWSEVGSSYSDNRTLEQRAKRARKRWSRAESAPFADGTTSALVQPEKKVAELSSRLLLFEIWEERFRRAFYNLLKELRQSTDKVEQSVAEDLNQLYAQDGELLARKTYDIALKVLETGELKSMLVRIGTVMVYIPFFPGLHDQPSLLKRYKSFSKGWVGHIEQMRKLLPSETEQIALVELALFLTPNLRQGVMYLAFQDKEYQLLPAGLLDEPEVRNAQGRLCGLRQVI